MGDEDAGETVPRNMSHHSQSALSLFPSSLCSAIIQIINLLDDPAVSDDGNAVYEVAYQVSRENEFLSHNLRHICYLALIPTLFSFFFYFLYLVIFIFFIR